MTISINDLICSYTAGNQTQVFTILKRKHKKIVLKFIHTFLCTHDEAETKYMLEKFFYYLVSHTQSKTKI